MLASTLNLILGVVEEEFDEGKEEEKFDKVEDADNGWDEKRAELGCCCC